MSAPKYFDELARLVTNLLDGYQNMIVNDHGGDYTLGEHIFHFLLLEYLEKQRLSPGLAVLCPEFIDGANQYFKIEKHPLRRFKEYEIDVSHQLEDIDIYTAIAMGILRLEDFNSKMRLVDDEKALGHQVRLSLCIECGRVIPHTVSVPSSICSDSCRISATYGDAPQDAPKEDVRRSRHAKMIKKVQKGKKLAGWATGQDASGQRMLNRFSRELARFLKELSLSTLKKKYQGSGAWKQLQKYGWKPSRIAEFEYYSLESHKEPSEDRRFELFDISGISPEVAEPTFDEIEEAVRDDIKSLVRELEQIRDNSPEAYIGRSGEVLRAELFALDPSHELARDPDFVRPEARKQYFTTEYIGADGKPLKTALRYKRPTETKGKKGDKFIVSVFGSNKPKDLVIGELAEEIVEGMALEFTSSQISEFTRRLVLAMVFNDEDAKEFEAVQQEEWKRLDLADQTWESIAPTVSTYARAGTKKVSKEKKS